jgi:tRNA (guanine37-N1)-methyltransferase
MKFDILTLFPSMFAGPFSESIIKRAVDRGILEIGLHNIRDYATGRHKVTDDYPYGGGSGMVMKVEPLAACIESVHSDNQKAKVVLTTPQGSIFNEELARSLATESGLIIICGRYEGIDERVKELFVDHEISVGDFVLTGGELAAMVLVDAVARFIPGVLGSEESAQSDTFSDGLLEYPQYTRPPEFRGLTVPQVLLSGNHGEIASWRRRQALTRTFLSRPDLLNSACLAEDDIEFLNDLTGNKKN